VDTPVGEGSGLHEVEQAQARAQITPGPSALLTEASGAPAVIPMRAHGSQGRGRPNTDATRRTGLVMWLERDGDGPGRLCLAGVIVQMASSQVAEREIDDLSPDAP